MESNMPELKSLPEQQIFRRLDAQALKSDDSSKVKRYTKYDFQRDMADLEFVRKLNAAQREWKTNGTTITKIYERSDWTAFVPTTFLEFILEGAGYNPVSNRIASSVTPPAGLNFQFRYFDLFERAQEVGEGDQFERVKGERTVQEMPFHTIGIRSYQTEEESLDVPIDTMRLELNGMGASMSLEQDLYWIDSLYQATSGTNATAFLNTVTAKRSLTINMLLAVITFMKSPFDLNNDDVTLSNDYEEVEGLQRLGKFQPTDIILGGRQWYDLLSIANLQQQHIWTNSRILDTGALEVPLLGVRFHVVNMGYLHPDDGRTWIPSDDIYIVDRNQGGGGTIGVRQPLQVREWEEPRYRTMDWHIYTRAGFVVQNRRGLIRLQTPSGS